MALVLRVGAVACLRPLHRSDYYHHQQGPVWLLATMGLPEFTADGLLPPGVHDATVEDMREALVEPFPDSPTRESIFGWWVEHRAALELICPVVEQWVDGSFVTDKDDPSDIDVVTVLEGATVDALPRFKQVLLNKYLIAGPDTKDPWCCDSYLLVRYAEDDVRYEQTQRSTDYWSNWFGHTRDGAEKGYVRVQ